MMQTYDNAAPLADEAGHEREDHEPVSASGYALFVIPSRRGDGFQARIRGRMFELADPDSGHGLVPTPEDLLVAAIASDIAWFARRFLRDHGLDDYVSVSARARTSDSMPGLGDVSVTVEVSAHAAAMGETLATALERRVAAQSSLPPQLRVRQG
jgi:uncharacterized OsmC-like protein